MDCSICCEKFNNSNHLKVECKGCDTPEAACRTCCKTYILNANSDAMCMFCKTPWEREFMINNLTKKFVDTDLKKYNEHLFMERQVSLLPDTQKDAIKEKKMRDLRKRNEEVLKEKDRLKTLAAEQDAISRAYILELSRLQYGTSTEDTSTVNFTLKCCASECNGFLDDKYHCSMCETDYCRMCMEIKEEGHVCNEETKATVQAIRRQAKPCPGCGEMISKIDGCDQMWCISCHIQFSWRTGQQMQGYNHNPEYFRWLRDSGQEIERNPIEAADAQNICGVRVDARYITQTVRNLFPTQPGTVGSFCEVFRFYRHVEWLVSTFPRRAGEVERSLLNLRVRYLLKDIGKEQWKFEIQKIDKQNKKNNKYENMWRLVLTVLESNFEKFAIYTREQRNGEDYLRMLNECYKFRDYINQSFINVSNTYGSQTCPGITNNWVESGNLKAYLKSQSQRQMFGT